MATYTITIGTGEDVFAGAFGYLVSTFGGIDPAGHELYGIVWKYNEDEEAGPLGWRVEILSLSLPVGTVVTWLGEDYALTDMGGTAGYSGPLLGGGPPPTSGTTEFSIAGGDALAVTEGADVVAVTGEVASAPATGTMTVTEGADTFSSVPPTPATLSITEGADSADARGYVLPRQPGLVAVTSGSTFVVPLDWGLPNIVRVIGSSGQGAALSFLTGGAGGGGGAYSHKTNLALIPGSTHQIGVGVGQDTWFGGTSYATALVAARKGTNASGGTPGTGGKGSEGIGDVCTSGGDGGAGGTSSIFVPLAGGGGGAGGNVGDGLPGGTQDTLLLPIAPGGDGNAGMGGLGGSVLNGRDGHNGTEYAGGMLGSGGGGAGGHSTHRGAGGFFGGGNSGDLGGRPMPQVGGVIIIEYTPAITAEMSVTEAPDTVAFVVMPPVFAAAEVTEGADTVAFAASSVTPTLLPRSFSVIFA